MSSAEKNDSSLSNGNSNSRKDDTYRTLFDKYMFAGEVDIERIKNALETFADNLADTG